MKKLIIFAGLVALFSFLLMVAQAVNPVAWTLTVHVEPKSLAHCGDMHHELWIEPGDIGEYSLCLENTTGENVLVAFWATADEGLSVYAENGIYEYTLMSGIHTFVWKVAVDVGATGNLSGTITVDDPP